MPLSADAFELDLSKSVWSKLYVHSTKYKDSKIESDLAKNAAMKPVDIYGCFNAFLPIYTNYLVVLLLLPPLV